MKQQDLTKLTLEELRLKEKMLKTSLGIFIGLFTVFIITVIFLLVKQRFTAAAVTPMVTFIGLILLLFFSKKTLADVQAEIKRRENKS